MLDGRARSAASRIIGVEPEANPNVDIVATPSA